MDNLLFLRMGITSGISFVLTGCVWWYAKKFGLLIDIPDSRSSHDTPIYRGGGIALFLAFLLSYFLMQWPVLPYDFLWSFIFFSGGTAFVGWMDDHCSLSPVLRFFFLCVLQHRRSDTYGASSNDFCRSLYTQPWILEHTFDSFRRVMDAQFI